MSEIKWKDIAEKDISGIKAKYNGKVAEVILFEGKKNVHMFYKWEGRHYQGAHGYPSADLAKSNAEAWLLGKNQETK